ncbi:MAG TPA: hypothetical protein VLB46_05045 [Pyrinomonadaceae bacterium]|nr:hypothetical protein [Pyrinomonadaceae bacterium]
MLNRSSSSPMSEPDLSEKTHAVSVLRRIDSAYVLSVASVVLVIVAALLVVYRLNPPGLVAASAAVTEFSGERALKHLTVIAQRPHPVGTSEHAAVASYIQNELAALGLSPPRGARSWRRFVDSVWGAKVFLSHSKE